MHLHNLLLLSIARKRTTNPKIKNGSKQHKTRKEQQIRTITNIMDIFLSHTLIYHMSFNNAFANSYKVANCTWNTS